MRCPECGSARVVVIVSSSGKVFCARCGVRWIQKGVKQRIVERMPGASLARHPRVLPTEAT